MYEFSDGSGIPLPEAIVRDARWWMSSGLHGGFLIGMAIKEKYEKWYIKNRKLKHIP